MSFLYKVVVACFLFLIFGSLPVFSQCPPPNPIVFGDSSCTSMSFTLSAINSPDTYNWYDAAVGGALLFQGDFYSTPLISSTTVYYVTSFDSGNNCESARVPVQATILPDAGNPAVFGTNQWNVYCFNDINWTTYKGFYIDNALNINSASIWNPLTNPSLAAGYRGCPIPADNHSISYKRKGFPDGVYRIEILHHNDDFIFTINGVDVLNRVGMGQSYSSAWIGELSSTTQVEYKWLDRSGASSATVNFIPISPPTDLFAGRIGFNQSYCLTGDPAPFVDSTVVAADRNASVNSGPPSFTIPAGQLITNSYAPDNITRTYLSFDVSSVRTSTFDNAFLYIQGYNRADYPNKLVFISSVADTSWNESSINWTNKPAPSAASLSASVVYDINQRWYAFDVSNYLLAQRNAGNKRVSFMLNDTTAEDNPLLFYSRQTAFPPMLVLNGKGGGCTGYTFQWQSSVFCDNNWNDIPGATNSTYDAPGGLTDSTCYRLTIMDGCASAVFSNTVQVNIDTTTQRGKLSVSEVDLTKGTIDINDSFGKIVQWEVSKDNFATAGTIIHSNSKQINYTGSPSSDLYYRAKVKSGSCPADYSDTVKIIKVQEFILFNSFSPNGDGINDHWKINGIERYPNNKVSIVNFMGVPVYEADHYDNESIVWDGSSSGQSLPDGTYYYSVQIPDKPMMTGFVVIKR